MKLLELNLINVDAVEKFAKSFLPSIEFEPAKKWFERSVRNLLINDEKFNTRVAQVSPTAPEWMKQRYKENIPLFRFQPSSDLIDKLSHIVDWLNSVYQVSQEKIDPSMPKAAARQQLVTYAGKLLNSLNSIDIKTLLSPKSENVKHHVDDWFDALNKFVKITGDKDQEMTSEDMHHVIDYDNGAWVELKSQKSLDIEGKLMGHCVGGYHNRVANGGTRIFSLRDNDNEPHVTIEVTDGKIVQVKGKSNKPPVEKYVPYVKDFLNKMKFPPTGGSGRYSSGVQDIKQLGLYYNAETQQYGSVKEVATVAYTTPDGFEILSLSKEEGDRPEYPIWKGDKLYGFIKQRYSNEFLIIIINDDDKNYYNEKNRKIYAEGVDFLNSAFKNFNIEDSDKFGFFKISEKDSKFYDINEIPTFKTSEKFPNGIEVKKILDTFYFILPGLKTNETRRYFEPLLTVDENGRTHFKAYDGANIDKSEFEPVFANFLNKNIKINHNDWNFSQEIRKTLLLDEMNIIYDGVGYKTYLAAAKLIKDFGQAKIFEAANIYRFYTDTDVAAEWTQTGKVIKSFKVENQKLRKYSKQLVEYLNENNISVIDDGRGKYTNSARIKNTLKEVGITLRGEKWTIGKTTGTGEGWSIEKVGTKEANIINPEGEKVASLKLANANTVSEINGDRSMDDEVKKSMLAFLAAYNKQNPKLSFNSDVIKNGKEFGFMIHNNKLVPIKEIYPSEDIMTVENMTWKKKAVILNSDRPENGYKYGLYNDNKLCVVLETNTANPKEIKKIIIINGEYDKKRAEEDYDYRHNNQFTKSFTKVNVAPYIDAISAIFKKEGFTAKGVYLSKAGIQMKNGKLQMVEANPKLEGFIDGLIQYDNGFSWRRGTRDKDEWGLFREANAEDGYENQFLTCHVTDEGINDIIIKNKLAMKKPSLYRGYLNDLLDVVEELNGEDSEKSNGE